MCSIEHVLSGTLPHSLVQVTLNTGRVRVATRTETDASVIEKCAENLRAGGGWSYVGDRTYVMLSASRGSGRVTLAWKGQGIEMLVVGILVWEKALARDAWTNTVAKAAELLALPRLTMPTQLPWLAAYLSTEAFSQPKAAIARYGMVARTAAWAILQHTEGN